MRKPYTRSAGREQCVLHHKLAFWSSAAITIHAGTGFPHRLQPRCHHAMGVARRCSLRRCRDTRISEGWHIAENSFANGQHWELALQAAPGAIEPLNCAKTFHEKRWSLMFATTHATFKVARNGHGARNDMWSSPGALSTQRLTQGPKPFKGAGLNPSVRAVGASPDSGRRVPSEAGELHTEAHG